MQIRQYLPIPPAITTTLLGGDYNPVTPAPNMPTLTTTSVLTSSLTLTSFVTVTTGQVSSSSGMASSVPVSVSVSSASVVPSSVSTATSRPVPTNLPPALVSAIEGLDDCTQSILFTNLASSPCNPADSSCICIQLRNAGLTNTIASTCTTDATTQYTGFQDNVCGPILSSSSVPAPVSSTPTASSTPASSSSMSSSSVIIVTSTTPAPAVSTPAAPVGNATTTLYTNTTLVPSVPSVPSDTSAPGPSTVLPEPPIYTGGAAVVKRGVVLGLLGVFAVAFAGL